MASPHKNINKKHECVYVSLFGAINRTQMSGDDRVNVNPQRKVRRGKGGANVEMKCHCVSPSLARVTTRSHPATV